MGNKEESLLSHTKAIKDDSNKQFSALISEFKTFSIHIVENNQKAVIEALREVIKDFNTQFVKIPIQINDLPTTGAAEVWIVKPFLKFGHLVLMSAPGPKNLEKFSNALMVIYSRQNKFGIKLLNEDGFNPNKYFDLIENNWALDKFPEHIGKAYEICTDKPSKILRS